MELKNVRRLGDLSLNQFLAFGHKLGGVENVVALLLGEKTVELKDVIRPLFDKNSRRIPLNLQSAVCDPSTSFKLVRSENIDYAERISRLAHAYELKVPITEAQFEGEAGQLVELVKTIADGRCANILKGICLPVIVPEMPDEDYGLALKYIYLPAMERAYKKEYPKRAFDNQCQGELAEQVTIVADTRHDRLVAKAKRGWQVILFFPNPLRGFSVHAQREQLKELPGEFSLAGGIDGLPAWAMWTDVLARDYHTPGADFSALQWRLPDFSLGAEVVVGSTRFYNTRCLADAHNDFSGSLAFSR